MDLKKLIFKFLVVGFQLIRMLVSGQDSTPFVEAVPGHDSIQIGSQTRILLSVATPDSYLWQWPELTDKITDNIEIVSQTAIDTIRQRRSDLLILRKQLTVTSFDSGFHAVPPLTFQYMKTGDTAWSSISTQPFLVFVAGLDVDLTLPIRDIKGPIKAPVTFRELFPWLLLAALIIAGILLYRRHLIRKRKLGVQVIKPVRPKIPPHTRALDSLEQLRQKKLWQSGRIKEYHSEITDILRHYLEERYTILAVEMTTSEIIEAINVRDIPSQAKEKLMVVFQRADLVKFAKSNPTAAQHEESFMLTVDFIRATIPVPAEQEMSINNNTSGNTATQS